MKSLLQLTFDRLKLKIQEPVPRRIISVGFAVTYQCNSRCKICNIWGKISNQSLLKTAMKQLYLSARAFHRILKLARTIADLENTDIIKAQHLAEAIQHRPRRML